jgi:hypothetical protein
MNIKHCGFLSWFHESRVAPKRKDHAQDCEMLRALRDQHPAILPWSLCFEWRPSFRWYGLSCPLRPAAGLLLDTPRGHYKVRALERMI